MMKILSTIDFSEFISACNVPQTSTLKVGITVIQFGGDELSVATAVSSHQKGEDAISHPETNLKKKKALETKRGTKHQILVIGS